MAADRIKFSELEEYVNCYSESAMGRETKNVVLHIDDIKALVKYCDEHPETAKINAVRFYFVRQNDKKREIVFNGQSQISLIGVPVKEYTNNEFDDHGVLINPEGGYDIIEKKADGDEIFSIYPHGEEHEHSGLCPYNCKGSINGSVIIKQ